MSLIERALEKARMGSDGERSTLPMTKRPQAGRAEAREMAEPQVIIPFPEARLRSLGYLPPPDQERRIASQYQTVKRHLAAAMRAAPSEERPDENQRLVMLTSAISGEGKTFNSINLALSLAAERDREVLLMDADFVKRTVTELFGLGDRPGFIEAVRDERANVSDFVVRTSTRNLCILPTGASKDGAADSLAGERTRQLLNQLTEDPRRIVVLDAAPMLLTTESSTLAHCMGQILLVVRAGVSPRAAVQHALSSLDRQHGVSLLFNGETTSALQDYLYGYDNSYAYMPSSDSNQERK